MKAKRVVVLFAVLLTAGSLSFAGDQKPFKGWVQALGDPNYNVDPLDYPYLSEIIQQRGYPLLTQIQLYQGINNVGGLSIHENVQMVYLGSAPGTIDIYEDSVITVANGDQIFVEIAGSAIYGVWEWTFTETVVGGTGRFEGAEGSIVAKAGFNKDGDPIVIYDGGYITTVGAAKKK